MKNLKQFLALFGLILTPLIVGFLNFSYKEADPFINAKVQPLSYSNLTGEPLFSQQFHFNHLNRGTTLDTYRGEGVTVAVIDSGLNTSHVDFFDNTQTNILDTSAYIEETGNYYSNISIQTVADYGRSIIEDPLDNGHGTNVAGTIGALVNAQGTAGVSPEVDLMILKVNYYFTEIDRAIRYATDNGADIINMSIGAYEDSFIDGHGDEQEGFEGTSTYFQDSINYAYNSGVTLIAAAGNEATDYPSYPASNNNVIGVGALARNSSSTIAHYSNYGLHNVDLVAPGSVYTSDIGSSSSYIETQGTSFSSPIVASAAALYKGKFPYATPAQIEQKLKDSAYDMGAPGPDETFGYGRLDLSSLLSDVSVTGVELSPSSLNLRVGETATLTANVTPSNATNKDVIFISNNDSVATVDETSGLVEARGVGTTTIGVLTDDGMFEDEIEVNVIAQGAVIEVTNISLTDGDFSLGVGASKTLSVDLSPTNATLGDIDFSSSDTAVATINASGQVNALAAGTTIITAEAKQGSASDSLTITVGNYVDEQLTYTFTSKSWATTTTSWTSIKDGFGYSNSGVQVTTGASGASAISPRSFNNIQAITIGYATNASNGAGNIKVYSLSDAGNTNNRTLIGSFSPTTSGGTSKRDTSPFVPIGLTSGYIQIEVETTTNSIYICDVDIDFQEQVVAPISVNDVNFTAITSSLVTGEVFQLGYEVLPIDADNKNVSFTSSNPTVAQVSSSGLVSALSAGTTNIVVTTLDGGYSDSVTILVSDPIVYEEELILNTSIFRTNYTFKQAIDLDNLSATYRASSGDITNLDGNDLTLISGNTSLLGSSTLVFQYLNQIDSVDINVTNIGALQGSGELTNHDLTITGTSFTPAISTSSGTPYSSVFIGENEFSGSGLRNLDGKFMIYDGGHFQNKNSLGTIKSIRFDYASGGSPSSVQTVRFNSSVFSSAIGTITETITSSTAGQSTLVNAPSGMSYFRIDITNRNLQASITINYEQGESLLFTAEDQASAYQEYFLRLTHQECLIEDVQSSTWSQLKNEYRAMVDEARVIVATSYSDLHARYNIIIEGYHFDDFIFSSTSPNRRDTFSQQSSKSILFITLLVFPMFFTGSFIIYQSKKSNY